MATHQLSILFCEKDAKLRAIFTKELLAFLDCIYPLSQSVRDYLIQNLKEIEIPKKRFLLKKNLLLKSIPDMAD